MQKRRKTYHGVSIGILMVDSRFQRFVGDIGNGLTWPFPVQYKIVRGAKPAEMISLKSANVLQPFKDAADELIKDGVDGITTTCGFLALFQQELTAHCDVPVATSALLQVPLVERILSREKRVGILTYSAESLTREHLETVGVAADTPVVGVPQSSEFFRSIMQGDDSVPYETLRSEVLDLVSTMTNAHPEVGAIVSECTNLTPYAADIQSQFDLPVYDMVSLMHWFHMGLRPRRFTQQ